MPRLSRQGSRWISRLGLIVLALNIMIASIPRCEMILTMLQHPSTVTAEHSSCHEAAAPVNPEDSRLKSDRLCACSLLKFMAFHLPQLDFQSFVIFRVQTERLLSFAWQAPFTEFTPGIEPPYPKA